MSKACRPSTRQSPMTSSDTSSNIMADANKKEYATSYVKAEVAEYWEAIPEFNNVAKTYNNFRDCLKELYNQTALQYILSDLDRLIGKWQRLSLRSLGDLSDFHFCFNVISSFLITNHLLSSREQSQAYLCVFDDALQNCITMHLQIIHQQNTFLLKPFLTYLRAPSRSLKEYLKNWTPLLEMALGQGESSCSRGVTNLKYT